MPISVTPRSGSPTSRTRSTWSTPRSNARCTRTTSLTCVSSRRVWNPSRLRSGTRGSDARPFAGRARGSGGNTRDWREPRTTSRGNSSAYDGGRRSSASASESRGIAKMRSRQPPQSSRPGRRPSRGASARWNGASARCRTRRRRWTPAGASWTRSLTRARRRWQSAKRRGTPSSPSTRGRCAKSPRWSDGSRRTPGASRRRARRSRVAGRRTAAA
mmetsp:Transcript_12528/g.50362  ORF Transcript_12528/g.50362 Transcript_12528/m.50362 type:complete len:216 (+) Transcript_12528:1417-2064(+)